MRIRGNTVGTTVPRPDWQEKNPKSAAYIRNKQLVVIGKTAPKTGPVLWFQTEPAVEHLLKLDEESTAYDVLLEADGRVYGVKNILPDPAAAFVGRQEYMIV